MGAIDATIPAREPFTAAHEWIEHHAGWLTLATAVITVFALIYTVLADGGNWILAVTVILFLVSATIMFTRPLGKNDSEPTPINAIFRFAYAFVFGILILGAVALFEPGVFRLMRQVGGAEHQTEWVPTLIAIVQGCEFPKAKPQSADATDSGAKAASSATCSEELAPQWVLSIGGSVLGCHFDGTCPQQNPRPTFDPDGKGKLAAVRADIKRLEGEAAELAADIATARQRASLGFRSSGASLETLVAERNGRREQISKLRADEVGLSAQVDGQAQWSSSLRYIEGTPIVGGLVVPVYFVVLAILGALVSMMRKIPEFQQRVEPEYPVEFAERAAADDKPLPPISRSRARDLVVFQVLQVVSAPTIAIVAYSYARPEELATTVLIAFAAGFSSEVFLVAVRAVVDRAVGLGPRQASRVVVDAPRKDVVQELPPRGPESSGGFSIGDAVTLLRAVGIAMPGAQGVILVIEKGGDLVVKLTHDHAGIPLAFRLPAAPASVFKRTADPTPSSEGPVG